MAGTTVTKTKVKTAEKKIVPVKTRHFAFAGELPPFAGLVQAVDLRKFPLQIKQVHPFFLFRDDTAQTEKITLTVKEIQGPKFEKKEEAVLIEIKGVIQKSDNWNFRVESVEQDPKKYPKPKNGRGRELWMPAQVEVVGFDDKSRGLSQPIEFVLPPLEYDETLELKLECSLLSSAVGNVKATWGKYSELVADLDYQVHAKRGNGVPFGPKQMDAFPAHGQPGHANMNLVVIHSMSAINVVGDKLTDCFNVDKNIDIFVNFGVSATFIIGRDGRVVEAVDPMRRAFHAGGELNLPEFKAANEASIGIELLGFPDDFREGQINAFNKDATVKKRAKLRKERDDLSAELDNALLQTPPEDGEVFRLQTLLAEKDLELSEHKLSPRAQEFEKLTADKAADGVALAFKYTQAQYDALGGLLEVFGLRYAYNFVCSHHYIRPNAGVVKGETKNPKMDPGIHFEWGKLTPYLLPGSLAGDEAGAGAKYTVSH